MHLKLDSSKGNDLFILWFFSTVSCILNLNVTTPVIVNKVKAEYSVHSLNQNETQDKLLCTFTLILFSTNVIQ